MVAPYRQKTKFKIGDKYNLLTIIEIIGTYLKTNSVTVKCKCDCGKSTVVRVSAVVSGAVKSCGHLRWQPGQKRRKYTVWEREYIKYQSSNDTRNKKVEFNLILEEFTKLVNDNCFYCGDIPNTKTAHENIFRNGIDRLNNKIGYIISNCVSCCKKCNFMKVALLDTEFVAQCIKIAEFQKKKSE